MFCKKVSLKIRQDSQENTCFRVFFNKVVGLQALRLQLYQKETRVQVFSCEFCEISKNIEFEEHLETIVSVLLSDQGDIGFFLIMLSVY